MPTNQNPDSINDNGFGLLEDRFLKLKPDLLLGNDSDPDGNTLSILSVQSAVGGTVAFDQDGDIVFTPTTNFHGAASFTYTVSDGNGGMDTATVSLNVTDDDLSLAQVSTRIGNGFVGVQKIQKGDFNGDGITDLQVMNTPGYGSEHVSGGATVTVTYANGIVMGQSGSLAMRLNGGDFTAAASNGPDVYKFSSVNGVSSFADMDGDGDADIVTANAGTSLAIMSGGATPDTVIDATTASPLGGFKYESALATDFNGDGKIDLFGVTSLTTMFGGVSATTPSLAAWMGTTSGPSASASFTAYSGVNPVGGATLASFTHLMGAVDINGDGYGDVVTAVGAGNDGYVNYGPVKITLGNATGQFEQNLSSSAGGLILNNFNVAGGDMFYREMAAGGDVNGDGQADMAGWARSGATGGFVLFGNSGYTPGGTIDIAALNGQTGVKLTGVSSGVSTMALGDLNGDGLGDIVVGSSAAAGGAGKLWVIWGKQGGFSSGNIDLSQEATGQFITLTGAAGQGIGSALSIADINGDGKNDLVIGSTSGTLDVVSHFAFPQNNAAPVAQGETLNGTEDQALTIQASALLSNDTDANGDILSIAGVSNAVGGSVTLNANGSVTFTPTENVNGPVSFEYTVSDGRGGTANATATINLAGINDAATVSIDRYTYASVDQVSSQYQSDISNFINVLTDTHETVALPEQYRNGTGPISLDNQEREVIVHFHSEVAGNQSVIGFYVINTDGSFGPARIVFPNASQTPPVLDPDDPNNPTDSYTSVSLGMFPAGTNFGLFMISNGAGNAQTDALIDQVTAGTAQISFVNGSNSGLTASLFDTVAPQLMVHDLNTAASTGTAINQAATPVFHTAASENAHFNGVTLDTRALNVDGAQHAAAGQGELNDGANTPAPDRIAIGWEDLAGSQNPDFDFNDVIIQVEIAEATVTQVNPANVGAAANLTLSDIDHPDQADADLTGASFRIADGFVTGDALGLGGGFTIGTNGAVLNQGVATGISVVGGGFGGDPANPNGLTLTGLADLVLYEQILRSVTFTSSSATAGIRTLNITVTDTGGAISPVAVEHLVVGNGTDQNLVGGTTGDDILTGTATTDLIYGDNGNDTLVGGSGDDLIYGGDGQDAMTGGIGADALNGGAGNDTASYGNSASGVTVHLGAGPGSGGDAQGDTLTGIENLTGSAFGDNLTGDAVANALNGGAGDDTLIGDYGNDTLDGGADGDWLDGGADDDTLTGGAGADMLIGNIGADTASYASSSAAVTVNLGTGTGAGGDAEGDTLTGIENLIGSAHGDTLNGDGNANVIQGGAGHDSIAGGAGADTLIGDDGNDTLNGGTGSDVLNGGAGQDMAYYYDGTSGVTVSLASGQGTAGDAAGDTLVGIEDLHGTYYGDTLIGDVSANILHGASGNDTLQGGGGNDALFGNEDNDTLAGGDGDDTLNGGAGTDSLNGDAGMDTASYSGSSAAVTVNLGTGTGSGGDAQGDTLSNIENLIGSAYDDVLNGNEANNTITGGAGHDSIAGGTGADTLNGDDGNDQLNGGDGNDTLTGGTGADLFYGGAGADILDGGGSTADQAMYDDSTAGVTVNLSTGTGSGGYAQGDTLIGIENVSGSGLNDVLTGDNGANWLHGQSGNDALVGNDGNDLLEGGDGNDTLTGGNGNDTLNGGNDNDIMVGSAGGDVLNGGAGIDNGFYMWSTAGVNVDLTAGTASGGDAQGDTLSGIEDLTGSAYSDALTGDAGANWLSGLAGNDTLIGNGGNDLLEGGDGNDILDGGAGSDTLTGGTGDDTYYFDGSDGMTEAANAGSDTVVSSVSYTLAANFENLTLTGTAALNATGNDADNILIGNSGANTINAGLGADTLQGGGGNDSLFGYAGNDTYRFGRGDGVDTFLDEYYYSYTTTVFTYSEENGYYWDTNTYWTYGNAGNDTLEFGAGITAADLLFETSGSNLIVGLQNAGGTLTAASQAADRVVLQNWYDVNSQIENFRFADGSTLSIQSGSAGDDVMTGSSGDDRLWGAAGNDTITGNAGNDQIDGGDGNDTLNGGDGNDQLTGGEGNDTMTGGVGADLLAGGNGTDTVSYAGSGAAVTVDLAVQTASGGDAAGDTLSGIEGVIGSSYNDTLTGSTAVDYLDGGAGDDMLFGGASADVLTGGDGNDTMDGGTGSDSMYGGAGNDIYYIESGDGISEAANAGTDTAISSVSFTLGANVENLTLTGTAALNATGNDVDNILIGNSGANTINAGLGNDTLQGGAGNDSLFGYAGNDTYHFGRGDGVDTVLDDYYYSYVVSGWEWSSEYGVYMYSSQTYWTYGNAGNDTLEFGAGITAADLLFETSGNNLIVGLQNAGGTLTAASQAADRVVLQNWYDVNSQIENFRFADGSTLLIQSGSAGDDVMTGSSGDDRLWGAAGNDTITGNAGNDQIDGGDGNDTLNGGDGNDQISGGNSDDTLIGGAGADVLAGGAGTDRVSYAGSSAAVTVDLAAQTASGGDAAGDTLSGFEGVIGSSYNDTLTGSAAVDYLDGGAGDDMLFGGASADVLTGGDGNDTMDGGTGSDSMYGGAGNDIYYIESGDGISEAANAGIDTAISSVSFTLGANVENLTLTGTAALNGVGNDLGNAIIGNSGVNALTGNSGADILHGAAGDDNLQGGLDNDVYRFNRGDGFDTVFDDYTYRQEYLEYNEWGEAGLAYRDVQLDAGQDTLEFGAGITAGDLLFETSGNDLIVGLQNAGGTLTAASQAADRVLLQNWYNVNDKIESIRFADGSTFSLQIGTSGNDALAGTTGLDLIIGQAGTDTVSYAGSAAPVSVSLLTGVATGGNAQGDILIGIENLTGSNNADTLIGDAVANVLNGGYGYDVLQGGAGNDTLNGGADSDNLNGGDGIDILNGDDGDDWLAGGAGADQLSGGAGIDTVYYSSAGAAVTVSLDTGTGTTGDAAGDTLTGIENLVGSAYDDIFTGSNGANAISGGGGNDTLHGYAGDDTLQGGTGIDVMNGGAGNDIYVMSRGDGIDSVVQSGISDAAMTTDILRFAGGVSYDQLWFRQDGNDLVINVIGETESQVSLKDWYIDASSRVDSIQTVDGNHAISAANIQSLVDAMAAYTAPPVGQMVLDGPVSNDLAPIFATTWA